MLPGDLVKRTTFAECWSYRDKSSALHGDERNDFYELFGCDKLELWWSD
jgi:hypothetical protein